MPDTDLTKSRSKAFLVTGGAGFLGASITRSLVQAGHKVTVLDNLERGALSRLAGLEGTIKVVQGDIRNAATVAEAVDGQDAVMHLAYINGTRHFYERPQLVLDVGIRGMLNLVDAVTDSSVEDVYLASSSEVYQRAPVIPTDESVPLIVPDVQNPRFTYGGGKITCELMALHWLRPLIKRMVIFRPHNVYGPDMGLDHVIPELTNKALKLSDGLAEGRPIDLPIKGDGTAQRAFIHIDDFVRGVMRLVDKGADGEIYHIGSDEETEIADLAAMICRCLGRDVSLVTSETPMGETDRRLADTGKMKALGFKTEISLENGIREVVSAMQSSRANPA